MVCSKFGQKGIIKNIAASKTYIGNNKKKGGEKKFSWCCKEQERCSKGAEQTVSKKKFSMYTQPVSNIAN